MKEASHTSQVSGSLLLPVIMLTSFFNSFMGAAINVALPQIGAEYSMNAVGLSWIAMAYLLSCSMFLVPFGKYADIAGRFRIFLWGNVIFLVASVISVIAPNGIALILSRALQGIGGSMILGTNMAIIVSSFPPHRRGRYIGMNISAVYLGLTLAPLIGGFLTQSFGWRSIFYVNILSSLFIVSVLATKFRNGQGETRIGYFDNSGAFIYTVSVFLFMYGFSKLPKPHAIILTLLGSAGLILFVTTARRKLDPVLNIRLFVRNRIFALSNLAAMITYAATYAITFVISLYLQYGKGFSPREAGLVLVTQPALMAVVATFSGRLADKYDSRILASAGMALITAGLVMLTLLHSGSNLVLLVASLMIVGTGFGFFTSPNTNSIMSSVEKKDLGIASAMVGTMRMLGMMISMGVAAMVIHVFMGDAKINHENVTRFINAQQITFWIFVLLCIAGIFASMARGKN